MTLSASLACSSKDSDEAVASTMRTLAGSRCRNSSVRMDLSILASPCRCCRWRRNCDGFLSPRGSSDSSCRTRWCALDVRRSTSCAFSAVYGVVVGGSKRRSRTSLACLWSQFPTTCQNLVSSRVMFRVRNWASTWANQRRGLEGQKGGSFTLTAETWAAGLGSTGGGGGISTDCPACCSASAVSSVVERGEAIGRSKKKKFRT